MPELTLKNIEEISRDVGQQEITFTHLRDELTDHLCCDVEYEMHKGLSFTEAYSVVRRKLGSRRLREIQEETLYAVDTKYRQMKNTMKISAIAGSLLLGFAALFKLMHWPGAGIMIIIGALVLAFVFMPSALTVLWKETHSRKRLFLYISAFIFAMLYIAGVVFKIQHWPASGLILSLAMASGALLFLPALLAAKLKDEENGSKRVIYILGALGMLSYIVGLLFKIQQLPFATLLQSAGLALVFLVVFPLYTRLTWKDDYNVSSEFIFMVIGVLAIVLPSLLISLNHQRNYETGYFILQKSQQEMYDYKLGENQAMLSNCTDSLMTPLLAQINSNTTRLLEVIDGVGKKMTDASEGDPFNTGPFSDYLMEGRPTRIEINDALIEYSAYLSGLIPEGNTMQLEGLLNPSAYMPESASGPYRISLMAGLHMLDLMKDGIMTAESLAFSAAAKNQ